MGGERFLDLQFLKKDKIIIITSGSHRIARTSRPVNRSIMQQTMNNKG